MRLLCSGFLILTLLFSTENCFGTSVTATQSGNWNQTDTWGGMAVPDGTPCYDSIIIPAGITVLITVTVDLTACPATKIFVGGALNFQTGKKLELSDGSFVLIYAGGGLQTGGGGGSSNIISIDGTDYWSAGCGGASPPPDCGMMTGPDILCQACSLPIELLDFSAELSEGIVNLDWSTASEEGNDYFWIQRSVDGYNWENLIWHDGAGNSNTLIDYHDEDRNPLLGLSYYRLKQVDMNGAHSYSETRVVSNGQFYTDQQLLVMNSANASGHTIVIYFSESIDGEVELIFAGMSGAVIHSEKRVLDNEKWIVITLDRPVAAGVYAVKANHLIEKVFFQ